MQQLRDIISEVNYISTAQPVCRYPPLGFFSSAGNLFLTAVTTKLVINEFSTLMDEFH